MSEMELKPCPLCGWKVIKVPEIIRCSLCGLMLPLGNMGSDNVVKLWNARASDPEIARLHSALDAEREACARIKAAFRVNALRWATGVSHSQIDAFLQVVSGNPLDANLAAIWDKHASELYEDDAAAIRARTTEEPSNAE